MSSTVWTKFFWTDWMSDICLRHCSVAARGLWMDMLCIAAQHDPIGLVAINGEGLSVEDIAKLAGIPATEALTLVSELERNDVFARTRTGIIYNRRMIRDAKKGIIAAKNGRLGGNPVLKAKTGGQLRHGEINRNSLSDNHQHKPEDKPDDKGRLKTQIPEARKKERKEEAPPPSAAASKYFFESGVIRLTKEDFGKWEQAFKNVNLRAELVGLSNWAAKQTNWYLAVSNALLNRDREAIVRREKAMNGHASGKLKVHDPLPRCSIPGMPGYRED